MIELILAKLAEKTTRYLAIALAAILLFGGIYIKGRSDGRRLAEGECAKQIMIWQAKVDQVTYEYMTEIETIKNKYDHEKDTLHAQLSFLQVFWDTMLPPKVNCSISEGFVVAHNEAADGKPLTNKLNTNLSNKKLSDVGRVVTTNYYECNTIRAQLQALQDVIRNYQQKQKQLVR